jgi:hypothetical protein
MIRCDERWIIGVNTFDSSTNERARRRFYGPVISLPAMMTMFGHGFHNAGAGAAAIYQSAN